MTERGRVWRWIAFAAVLTLALGVRLLGIGDRSVWFDEAFSWTLAQRFSTSEMVARTAVDVHPPFYYFVLSLWTTVFGSGEIALRGLSALLGAATVALLFFFSRECFRTSESPSSSGSRFDAFDIALIASGCCAVSAYHIHWSQEARMYTLATALAVASAWALLRALETPEFRRYWIMYAALAACLLYTHNYAIFTVFAQALFVALWFVFCGDERRRVSRKAAAIAAGLSFTSIAWAYAPWLPVLRYQKAQVQEEYWIAEFDWMTVPKAWVGLLFPENDFGSEGDLTAIGLLVVICLAVAAFSFVPGWRRRFVLSLAVVPVLCSVAVSLVSVSIIVPRHFMLSYVFLLCIFAAVLADAVRGKWRWIAFGWLLVVGVAVHYHFQAVELNARERPGIRGAIAALRELRAPDERVVVLHPCIYFSALYYLDGGGDPKLYLPGEGATHFTGGPILQATDFISPSSLSEIEGDAIWVLDTSGFSLSRSRYPLPPEWVIQDGSRRAFRDVYYFQGDVFLTRYVRLRQSANVSDGREG